MPNIPKSPNNTQSARERILYAAQKLFYNDGIRATGVDRLIAEAGVTKTTFYRHFPSKNDLIRAFLEYRHKRWCAWFCDSLERHGKNIEAVCPALAEWFQGENYRGCAFINSLAELGGELPEIVEITVRHKQEMTDIIENILPSSNHRKQTAKAISLAIEGAIVQAQYSGNRLEAIDLLRDIISAILLRKASRH